MRKHCGSSTKSPKSTATAKSTPIWLRHAAVYQTPLLLDAESKAVTVNRFKRTSSTAVNSG